MTEPVKGLFEAVKTTTKIADWHVEDQVTIENDGTRVAVTVVKTPDGETGAVERAHNPRTGLLELRNAFLGSIPGWVNEGGPGISPAVSPRCTT